VVEYVPQLLPHWGNSLALLVYLRILVYIILQSVHQSIIHLMRQSISQWPTKYLGQQFTSYFYQSINQSIT